MFRCLPRSATHDTYDTSGGAASFGEERDSALQSSHPLEEARATDAGTPVPLGDQFPAFDQQHKRMKWCIKWFYPTSVSPGYAYIR